MQSCKHGRISQEDLKNVVKFVGFRIGRLNHNSVANLGFSFYQGDLYGLEKVLGYTGELWLTGYIG